MDLEQQKQNNGFDPNIVQGQAVMMPMHRENEAREILERIESLQTNNKILSEEAMARIPTIDTGLGNNEKVCIIVANLMKCICSILFFPYFCLMLCADCCYNVGPMEAAVFTQFGKPARVQMKPGCYCKYQVGCGFSEYVKVSLRIKSRTIMGSTVPDLTGAPM